MGPSSPIGPVGPVAHQNDGPSTQLDVKAVVEAVAKLNTASAVGSDNEIVVTLSDHRLTIQVVNRESRTVVEQISPPSIFRMLKRLSAT
jgi:hypothetical protein